MLCKFYSPIKFLGIADMKLIPHRSRNPKTLEQDAIDHFRINTLGAVHLFNAFIPLILKGHAKKLIAISSGMSDPEMTLKADIYQATSYAMSKAALNMAVAKFSAVYREKGVLCMAVCPGAVDTGSLNIGMKFILDK
jgi:NAD(P)-dependent dehydrogenase (short-subunit alcohol dehydrogenase family)